MDANTLRLILIVVGVMLIVALYLWERRRARADDDDEFDDPVHWDSRRDPDVDVWDSSPAGARRTEPDELRTESLAERVGLARPDKRLATVKPRPVPRAPAPEPEPVPEPEPDLSQPLIVQISLTSRDNGRFDGAAVVAAASACGLEPGEMDVFHCYLGDENEQHTLFRVANLVKPGTFPFGAMDGFETPGVVLFASLDGDPGDLAVIDEMVATARCLAEELKAEIRDETRNPFTAAKEETLRARVLARQVARESEADAL